MFQKPLYSFVFCFVLMGAFAQNVEDDIRKQVDKILAHDVDIKPNETPGCLIGIIEVDTFFILEYGSRADGTGALSKTDIFDLGGLSKIFVSAVANSLVESEIFQYSDELQTDFPEWEDTSLGRIQFEDLLKHESGIKKVLIGLGLEGKTRNEEILESDFKQALKDNIIDQKKDFQYSHHNYSLLCLWMKKRTKKDFPDLLKDFLSKQIENYSPSLYFDSNKYIDSFSGFNKIGKLENAKYYGTHEYSQGIQSDITSLMRFTKNFWLDEDNVTAQMSLTNHSETKIRKSLKFSRSFYVIQNRKYTIYTHSGRSNRHTAAIHFVPETKTGVVLLSNSEIGTKDLSLLILRMINHNWKRKAHGQEK